MVFFRYTPPREGSGREHHCMAQETWNTSRHLNAFNWIDDGVGTQSGSSHGSARSLTLRAPFSWWTNQGWSHSARQVMCWIFQQYKINKKHFLFHLFIVIKISFCSFGVVYKCEFFFFLSEIGLHWMNLKFVVFRLNVLSLMLTSIETQDR